MAERRRRRSTECDSEGEHTETALSELDSTADESKFTEETEESDDSQDYVTEEEETAEEEEDEEEGEGGTKEGERQSGDGQEQPKLDDDEDQKNPAYIPRRGAFYEHDMRLDPNEEKEAGDSEDKRGKGRLWKDEAKKWSHDKFDAYDQAPKSRQELIAMYGYDITQNDAPPEHPPKMGGGRRGRGGRNRKPQFQDFLPDDGNKRRSGYGGSNRNRYSNDEFDNDHYNEDTQYGDSGPRQSKSDSYVRGGSRGRRGYGRGGQQHRRSYTDYKEERSQRNRTYSGGEIRDYDDNSGRDNYGNRDNRDNYGNRDNRDNYGNRDTRDKYGNRDNSDNYGNRDNYGGRGNFGKRDNYGNRDNFGKRDNFANKDRDNFGNRDENTEHRNYDGSNRNDSRGYADRVDSRGQGHDRDNRDNRDDYRGGRGRGGFRGNRGGNREEFRESLMKPGGRGRSSGEFERQSSGGGRDIRENRDRPGFDRQSSGGGRDTRENRDRPGIDRQHSGNKESDQPYRKTNEGRDTGKDRDTGMQDIGSGNRSYIKSEAVDRALTRSYEKPSPKSYYTLSVTDDEKLLDDDYTPGVTPELQDMNVTVTGDRRSFKDRDRPRMPAASRSGQEYGGSAHQQAFNEDRRETPSHGPVSKHQPTLPPRLQQQQQQERNKRQKQQQQQQQQQQSMAEKHDPSQSRSTKRYSSQRQRAVPEGPGFTEPQTSQSQPVPQIVTSTLQQQYQPNFSPPKAGTGQQASVMVRPAISPQRNAPPQMGVQSPTMVIPRVPPPQAIIPGPPVPPPPQAHSQRPPPPPGAVPRPGPGLQAIRAPPPGTVFAQVPGTLPTTAVIGAPAQLISPAGIAPAGIIYAGPPPAFQVPVPQFSAAPQVPPATPNPGERVHGGTTYYSQASGGGGGGSGSGTIYYSPEMQMTKQSRVQVRRPKAPLSIVNPVDVKGEPGSPKPYQEDTEYSEDSNLEQSGEFTDSIDENPIPYEQDEAMNTEEGECYSEQIGISPEVNDNSAEQYETIVEPGDLETSGSLQQAYQVEQGFVNDSDTKQELNEETEIKTHGEEIKPNVVVETIESNAESVPDEVYDDRQVVEERLKETKYDEEITSLEVQTESKTVKEEKEVTASQPAGATFVVKTEQLSPTLSISTSVKPASDNVEETRAVATELENNLDIEETMESVEDISESKNMESVKIEEESNKDVVIKEEKDDEDDEFVDSNDNFVNAES